LATTGLGITGRQLKACKDFAAKLLRENRTLLEEKWTDKNSFAPLIDRFYHWAMGSNNPHGIDLSQVPNQEWCLACIYRLILGVKHHNNRAMKQKSDNSKEPDQEGTYSQRDDVILSSYSQTSRQRTRSESEAEASDSTHTAKRAHCDNPPTLTKQLSRTSQIVRPSPMKAEYGPVPCRYQSIRTVREDHESRPSFTSYKELMIDKFIERHHYWSCSELSFQKFVKTLQEDLGYNENEDELGYFLDGVGWQNCEEERNWRAACTVQQALGNAWLQFYLHERIGDIDSSLL
jgi:hypothetical protein